jgi:H+/Cl- antiporter ClcA
MAEMSDVERLLRSALVPVEPREPFTDRLEVRLTELTDAAIEELAEWDAVAMRDPRNWWRPVAAAVVVGVAGAALVVVRTRQQQRKRQGSGMKALEQSVREVTGDIRRRLQR